MKRWLAGYLARLIGVSVGPIVVPTNNDTVVLLQTEHSFDQTAHEALLEAWTRDFPDGPRVAVLDGDLKLVAVIKPE
jgi:hypothetical protein